MKALLLSCAVNKAVCTLVNYTKKLPAKLNMTTTVVSLALVTLVDVTHIGLYLFALFGTSRATRKVTSLLLSCAIHKGVCTVENYTKRLPAKLHTTTKVVLLALATLGDRTQCFYLCDKHKVERKVKPLFLSYAVF